MKSNTKIKSLLDYMTKKSPDSQKVWLLTFGKVFPWLREMVVTSINGCCFSVWSQTMSRLLHNGEGFGGRNREGAHEPPGKRKCAEVCSFGRGTEGGKTFLLMWLSCPPLPYFSCPTLASLSLIVFVFPVFFMSNRFQHFHKCLCATVGTAHTSLRGQSPQWLPWRGTVYTVP